MDGCRTLALRRLRAIDCPQAPGPFKSRQVRSGQVTSPTADFRRHLQCAAVLRSSSLQLEVYWIVLGCLRSSQAAILPAELAALARAESVSPPPLPPPVVNRCSASRVPRMRPPGLLGFQVLFPSRLPPCETVVRRILLLLLLPFENARPALGAGHRTAPHRTAHVETLPSAPCEPHRHEFCQGRAGERRHDELGQQVAHCSRER